MTINNLFNEKRVVFSFEVFPPKPTYPIENIYNTLEDLKYLHPDYISVTYGAGGSVNDNRTAIISSLIKEKHNIESLAHLTCIDSTREQITSILENLKKNNINNILALRGDKKQSEIIKGDFTNSQELIRYVKESGDFGIAAACYPEA